MITLNYNNKIVNIHFSTKLFTTIHVYTVPKMWYEKQQYTTVTLKLRVFVGNEYKSFQYEKCTFVDTFTFWTIYGELLFTNYCCH